MIPNAGNAADQDNFPQARTLELYAGIGGLRLAWQESQTILAVDISEVAKKVYEQNFASNYQIQEIETLRLEELAGLNADVWWLSPPCQPFSRRGKGRDANDPRSKSLLHLIRELRTAQLRDRLMRNVRAIVLENVEGFWESECQKLWCSALEDLGFELTILRVCPSRFGWPNRRPRLFVIASREALKEPQTPTYHSSWQSCLEPVPPANSELWLDADQEKFAPGLDRVDLRDPQAVTACFGSSYGKSILHAGSYIQTDSHFQTAGKRQTLRRFSPREVANLLGFPRSFRLAGLSNRQAWKLLGNGLSIPAARFVLAHLPFGPDDATIDLNDVASTSP